MSTVVAQSRLRIAFAGAFAVRAENIHRVAQGEPPVNLISASCE